MSTKNKKQNSHSKQSKNNLLLEDKIKVQGREFGLTLTSDRFFFFAGALLLVVIIYISLYSIQFFSNIWETRSSDELQRVYKNRIERNVIVSAPRGDIVDANGNILATSVPYQSFALDAKVFTDPKYAAMNNPDTKFFKSFAQALGTTPEKLHALIYKNPNSRYVKLGSKISPTLSEYIKNLKIPGLTSYTEYKRFYPYGEATAQLLGLLDNENFGQFGVEKLVNDQLQGTDGKIRYLKDIKGNILYYDDYQAPQKGQTVKLTIDSKLQAVAFQAVQQAVIDNNADAAMAALVEVATGKILAMAGANSFNPNDRNNIDPSKTANLLITRAYEPGSTVKPFVVYAGLKYGVIKPNSLINTAPFTISGHTIKDVAPRTTQSIRQILQNSSNIGVATIALKLRGDEIYNTYKAAGFGEPTNLGLTGELKGNFFKYKPSNLDRAVQSYGYGQLVTPLQLVHAYSTLGNMGKKLPLKLIDDGKESPAEQVLDAKVVKTVIELMEGVAEHNHYVQIPNYNLSIKTGTAKRISAGVYSNEYTSLTAGVAPSTNPKFALVVIIDRPKGEKYYGGAIAAPVWKEIMYAALQQYNVLEDNTSPDRLIISETGIKAPSDKK